MLIHSIAVRILKGLGPTFTEPYRLGPQVNVDVVSILNAPWGLVLHKQRDGHVGVRLIPILPLVQLLPGFCQADWRVLVCQSMKKVAPSKNK